MTPIQGLEHPLQVKCRRPVQAVAFRDRHKHIRVGCAATSMSRILPEGDCLHRAVGHQCGVCPVALLLQFRRPGSRQRSTSRSLNPQHPLQEFRLPAVVEEAVGQQAPAVAFVGQADVGGFHAVGAQGLHHRFGFCDVDARVHHAV